MLTKKHFKNIKNMLKPKVIILSGYGLNCEEETAFAFNLAGAESEIIHINDLDNLDKYQILAIPGGFSFGDDTGSGNAYALKLKNHYWEEILKFITKDKLVIGICNGFQILVRLGIFGEFVALLPNDNHRYTDKWVDLNIISKSPWLLGINEISLPVAHGEGNFFYKNTKIEIAAKYTKETNPNGSIENIAAITDKTKKILGIMPHPERAMFFTQLPNWPFIKEKLKRENKKIPKYGPGLEIFKNGVKYFK